MRVNDQELVEKLVGLTPAKRQLLRQRLSSVRGKLESPAQQQITAIPRDGGTFAASFAQERLWVLSQLISTPAAYNIAAAFDVVGDLDLPRLEAALQALVKRHEALRTSFEERDEGLRQVIHATVDLRIKRENPPSQSPLYGQWIGEFASRLSLIPFDLGRLPLLRIHVAALARDHHVLLIVMHHIISDAWSTSLMVRELAEEYSGPARPESGRRDRIDYVDYALWQRRRFEEGAGHAGLQYWKEKLANCPETLELPCDRPRPPKMTYRGHHIIVESNGEFKRGMLLLAQASQCSPGTLMVSILQVFLARYTAQMDLTIGVPVANRQHPQSRDIVGLFVNTIVLRQIVNPSDSFRQHLVRTQSAFLEAQEHQDVPFEKLVEELRPSRSVANTPLFEVLFNYLEDANLQLRLPGTQVREIDYDPGAVRVSLSVDVRSRANELTFAFQYSEDLFDRETVEDMAENFLFFAQEIFSDPGKPLNRYRMIAPKQYATIVTASSGMQGVAR